MKTMMKRFHFIPNSCKSLTSEATKNFSRVLLMLAWVMTFEGRGGGMGEGGVQVPQQFDGCVWSTQDGVINLAPLANTDGTARFSHVLGTVGSSPWYYSYNPCFPFSEGTCANTAVCQTDQSGSMYFDCGYSSTAQLSTDEGKPAIKYTADTTIPRTSHVALVCDQSATEPNFVAIGDTGQGDYHFVLTTVCACPNKCGNGGITVEVEISVGTILIIIVLVVALLYLVGGMVFNRVARQKSGTEMFPHGEFWKALPGTVKDGCTFSFSKLRGVCSKSGSYQSM